MSDALMTGTVLLVFAALWGALIFLAGWRTPPAARSSRDKLRRFGMVVFAACIVALLVAMLIRTSIPRNAAVQEATRLAEQSPQVQALLGNPVRYAGLVYGGYHGMGEGSRISAGVAVKGSHQSAIIHSCGTKVDGQWRLRYAEVIAASHRRVSLTPGWRARCE